MRSEYFWVPSLRYGAFSYRKCLIGSSSRNQRTRFLRRSPSPEYHIRSKFPRSSHFSSDWQLLDLLGTQHSIDWREVCGKTTYFCHRDSIRGSRQVSKNKYKCRYYQYPNGHYYLSRTSYYHQSSSKESLPCRLLSITQLIEFRSSHVLEYLARHWQLIM